MPILQGSGHAYTNVVLNGVDLRLILDTGSAETIVSKAAAKRLGLSLNAAGYAYGVGGSTSAYVFEARSFRIGRLSGTRLPLLVSDFDFPIGALKADGLLGVDFLSAYDLDLDFKSRRARLFKVVSGCSSPAAVMAEPLYFAKLLYGNASPTVQVRIGNETVVAVVDTGAPDTAMFRGAARRLGLISEAFAAGSHGVPRRHRQAEGRGRASHRAALDDRRSHHRATADNDT